MFFHGNRKNILHYESYAPLFTSNGYEVWMADYPGFGKSTGKRNEQTLYQQAELIYNMACQFILPENIIIYGKSIGTGPASELASKKSCKKLILETPYYTMTSLFQHYFPVLLWPKPRYSFPVYHYLKKVTAPIYILHGTKDEVIPFTHAGRLKKENPSIELHMIKSGKHNNLLSFPNFKEKLSELLQ